MTSSNNTTEEKRKSLYTYWHELPYFKTMNSANLSLLQESEVKSFIIKYIRDGIEDKFGNEHNLLRRHAFTAKELYEAYSGKSTNGGCSVSNFHFHINSLVEDGYLKEITKILDGRHYSTYYGRTAVSFVQKYDDLLTARMSKDVFDPLKKLIRQMNPELKSDYETQLIEEHLTLMQDFYYKLFSWMREKYPHLYSSKMDLQMFIRIVGHFSFLHEKLAESTRRIGSLIDLDQIMDYERYEVER
jgi:hypothetical protein